MKFGFIELPPFSAMRDELFASDEDFAAFQDHLAEHPDAGVVIPQTGGCRKLRWAGSGRGKRGGSRVIYFLRMRAGQIVLVAGYTKNERDDLPRSYLRKLKEIHDHE
jgi:mRNA-degrading endonuclease RelE of RelBE toxin-antitoxin system